MPKFSYKAITDTGASTQGEIDADSVESASSLIAARGYIPTQVRGIKGGAPAVKLSWLDRSAWPSSVGCQMVMCPRSLPAPGTARPSA